ncbi:MAG: acylphosphatase [Pseudomonadota bacterium]
MSLIRRRVLISGIVQGVCYRAFTRDAAIRRGVAGWVRNLSDGRVEAVFQGEEERVRSAVDWCYRGSPGSLVESVEVVEEEPVDDLEGFTITYMSSRSRW